MSKLQPTQNTAVDVVASAATRRATVATLTEAFHRDPVFSWLCPDETRRPDVLTGWFTVITEALGHHGATHLTSDRAGAAVWVPPGVPMVDDEDAFIRSMVEVSPVDADRFGTLMAEAEDVHPAVPHWYLFFVGVRPDQQGCGIGTRLLREVLDICDRDGIPAYLESTCPENRRLYERHGFTVTGEISLPDGPTPTTMWRDPQSDR